MRLTLSFTLSLFLACSTLTGDSWAAKPGVQARKKSTPAARATAAGNLLWDEWYTVTAGGKTHYGYYNERVEIKNNQIYFKNDFWKQEEDYINSESLGVFSENNDALSPLFFNFHSLYRTTETTINGNIRDGRNFTGRIQRNGKDLPLVTHTVANGVFYSSLFPVWIGKRLATMQVEKDLPFRTIMEDNIELGFDTMDGSVRLEKPDDFARSSGTKKLRVDSRGMRTYWWVNDRGTAQRIEMPEQKIVVERTTREKAKNFLNGTI